MTVLLDTWAWIEYHKGSEFGKLVREYLEGEYEVITSAVCIAEISTFLLREGNDLVFSEYAEQVSLVIPVDVEIARQAAILKIEHKMGLADAIVWATAQSQGATVVTGDEDFKGKKDVVYLRDAIGKSTDISKVRGALKTKKKFKRDERDRF